MDNTFIQEQSIEKRNVSIIYIVLKRIIDITGSLVGFILLAPLFLIIVGFMKYYEPNGPIFFAHERIGLNGEKFKCYKFRSMVVNAQEIMDNFTPEQKSEFAQNFKLKDDPRITPIGKFIRNTSLDELPQLWNILVGEMTIVGPRPIVEKELELYGVHQYDYMSMKPGLTGMWQVHGRSDTTYEERVLLDLKYMSERCIYLDINLIFMTIFKVVKREGAY